MPNDETRTTAPSLLRHGLALGALGLVALTALLAVLLLERRTGAPPPELELAQRLDRQLDRAAASGIAVLPFQVPPDDGELGAVRDGLCEAIVDALLRAAAERITSCSSSQLGAQAGLAEAQLASLLGVQRIVRGEVVRGGTGAPRVRVSVYDAASGREQWQFEHEVDARGLQTLPARIQAQFRPSAAVNAATIDATAYRDYLRALQLTRRGNVDDLRAAVALYDKVLAVAPDYAPALVNRLFVAAGVRSLTGVPDEPQHERERAAVAQQLLRLDAASAHARLVLAESAVTQRDWVRVFDLIDEALAQRPHDPRVLRYQAYALTSTGYLRQARAVALRAAQADPMSANSFRGLANIDLLLGDDQRALENADLAAALGLRSTHVYRGFVALRRADYGAAESELRAALKERGQPDTWLAAVLAAAADPRQRAAALRALEAAPAAARAAMDQFLVYYGVIGAPERALEAALRLAQGRRSDWANHVWSPELAALRRLDGFAQYAEAMGFVALWERRGAPDGCRRQAAAYRCD